MTRPGNMAIFINKFFTALGRAWRAADDVTMPGGATIAVSGDGPQPVEKVVKPKRRFNNATPLSDCGRLLGEIRDEVTQQCKMLLAAAPNLCVEVLEGWEKNVKETSGDDEIIRAIYDLLNSFAPADLRSCL